MNDTKASSRLQRGLGAWAAAAADRALPIVIASVLLAAAALWYTAGNLRINTDTDALFSPELQFRKDVTRHESLFPQFEDNLVAVVDADTPEVAGAVARDMAQRLTAQTDLFTSVYVPKEEPFLVKHGLLFLSPDDLDELTDKLAEVQPYLGSLTRDESLRGLFKMLGLAQEARDDGKDIDLSPVYSRVDTAIADVLAGRESLLSWQELIAREDSAPDDRRRFVILKLRVDFAELFPAGPAIAAVREAGKQATAVPFRDARIRLTGGIALSNDELKEVSDGIGLMLGIAFVMVALVLFIGLRAARLVVSTLITLALGLVVTGGFAAVAIGNLNLVSVAFSILYVGLGVDYAIHFCLRYRELRVGGLAHRDALYRTGTDIGPSILACAITTGAAFYAFVPATFLGVSELGLISGTGMFISFLATMSLLPAMITLLRIRPPAAINRDKASLSEQIRDLPLRRPMLMRAVAVAAAVVALAMLPGVRFDANPLNVRNPKSESVETFRDLLRTSDMPPWHAVVLAAGPEAAADVATKLRALPEVSKVVSALDFVPEDQDEKLDLLEETATLLGPELGGDSATNRKARPSTKEQIEALRSFTNRLSASAKSAAGRRDPGIQRLRDRLVQLQQRLDNGKGTANEQLIAELEASLLTTLPENLERLRTALEVGPVTEADLPTRLRDLWIAPEERVYRVLAFPRGDLNDPDVLERFVASVRTVDPHATDDPVVMLESGREIVGAFRQAILLALLATCVVLFVSMRSVVGVLQILAPILLAGLLTGATMVTFGLPFNFANIIALPLLLGIGVDNGIHIVHSTRARIAGKTHLILPSTTRGVVFSTMTTVCGFGDLSLSPHVGTASMGKLLLIGILLTLACSLFVLPALLVRKSRANLASPEAAE